MKNDLYSLAGDLAFARMGVISVDEVEALRTGQIGAFACIEVVNSANVFVAGEKSSSDRAAHEAGNAGYELFGQGDTPEKMGVGR